MASLLAKVYGVPKIVVRISDPEHLDNPLLLKEKGLHTVYPEKVVADKIAQKSWFGQVLGLIGSSHKKEPDRYLVIVHAREFKNFVMEQKLNNKYLVRIFKDIPKIVLDGATKIPFPISNTE